MTRLAHLTLANAVPVFATPISISVASAADLLGISERDMRRLLNKGAIDSRYHGRRRLVSYEGLKGYFVSLPIDPPAGVA